MQELAFLLIFPTRIYTVYKKQEFIVLYFEISAYKTFCLADIYINLA